MSEDPSKMTLNEIWAAVRKQREESHSVAWPGTAEISDNGENDDAPQVDMVRLQAYARVIADTDTKDPVSDGWLWEWYPAARAAIKRADAESVALAEKYVATRLEVERSHREVGRLSAENAELHRYHREDQDALTEMRATIEGMRAELDKTNTAALARYAEVERLRADRAAVLREAADAVALFTGNELDTNAKMLRRLADEAQEGES